MESCWTLLAFDADDTLWECQAFYEQAEREYAKILAPYGSAEEVSASLFAVETANMPLTGYGAKAFTISLVENAVEMSHGDIAAHDIMDIVQIGKKLINLPGKPLAGVRQTLQRIRATGCYGMVVFTKGEILDQEHKFVRSGLAPLFDDLVVVSDKTPESYEKLCRQHGCDISRLLMVGNSFKSDISPVLQLGGWGAYIPHNMWQHEQAKEYAHPKLIRLENFCQLENILL